MEHLYDSESWWSDTEGPCMKLALKIEEVIHQEKSEFQEIFIFKTKDLGNVLVLDGALQTTEKDDYFYNEQIVHPAVMLAKEGNLNALIIGGGDGGVARELLKHPSVKRLDMVEIDRRVVELSQEYLPALWRNREGRMITEDPRMTLTIGDGLEWVQKRAEEGYRADVIIADVSDPTGPSMRIFGESFFTLVRTILKEMGIFTIQSEGPVAMRELHDQVFSTVRRVFPDAARYIGTVPTYPGSLWSYTCCGSSDAALEMDVNFQRVLRRYSALVEAGVSFRIYNPFWHRSAFILACTSHTLS